MGARQRQSVFRLAGFVLIVTGFLAFAASFFLLPLYVTTYCGDGCDVQQHGTAWKLTWNVLSGFSIAPVFGAILLVLLYLPLLAAVVVMGGGLGFLANPARAFVIWIRRGCLAGSIPLAILLVFLALFGIFVRPDLGCYSMLAGYALFWGGYFLFLTAHRQARYEP